MLDLIFGLFIATFPLITSVTIKQNNLCGVNEFPCDDGSCVSLDLLCLDGNVCADGSDQRFCTRNEMPLVPSIITRTKRVSKCSEDEWQCQDRACIPLDGICDGAINCPDGSDETFPLCRDTQCSSNLVRCTYGACVDGTAQCDGKQDCADNSDELHPNCFNATENTESFKCQDGKEISSTNLCDGNFDCFDKSDETIEACSAQDCPSYVFQCAYGACVDQGSNCNGKIDCADGSDESVELCNKTTPTLRSWPFTSFGTCELPEYPENGRYSVSNVNIFYPRQRFDSFRLNVSCNPGYGVKGRSDLYCSRGLSSGPMPSCVRMCTLKEHPSVDYICIERADQKNSTRKCEEQEPSGTVVFPMCREPNYYYTGVLGQMKCIEGSWDYVAVCQAECGRVTPSGETLMTGGTPVKHGEVPWHAAIYTKVSTPYMQICGGSIISNNVVITAAHCFWEDKLQPPSDYVVAVGKIYRPWNNSMDSDQQISNVSDIKIPPRYGGVLQNFQEDIALVFLSTPIVYHPHVRPVCLNFDDAFENRQLKSNHFGKVAGWGLTAENGMASQVLKAVDLPYIEIEKCSLEAPDTFKEYLTSDKICAGYTNGTALCKGDSGGGLAFPDYDRGHLRYYLRGIASTTPRNNNLCSANFYTAFTQVKKHDHFIQEFVSI